MAKLHRNPLIHPEVALSVDEAMATLGIARSVVTAMLAELPVLPQTTSNVPVPSLSNLGNMFADPIPPPKAGS
jgi:hypothetical protein